ncbi:MAG: hypothetical protein M1817_002895 [Caeruleum heppii]|nr:MAG: hypothetical protein M1817_002895 [Caeruleum heppii]
MPRRPRARKGYVWPQDRRNPRKPFFLRGLSDILSGRGADIYVGSLRGKGPNWTQWGRWPEYGEHPHMNDDVLEHWRTPWWARSRKGQRYYPETRRYERRHRPGPAPPPTWGPWGHDPFGNPHLRDPHLRHLPSRDRQDARWRRHWTSMPQSREDAFQGDWTLDPHTGEPLDGWREGWEGWVGTPWDGPWIGGRDSGDFTSSQSSTPSVVTNSTSTW